MFNKKLLSRDSILAKDDLPKLEVDVPEWDGKVYVRTMTGAERDKWEVETVRRRQLDGDASNIRSMIAALTVCDADGVLLFTQDDVDELGKKSCAALDRIVDVAMALNHFTADDIEGLEKNS